MSVFLHQKLKLSILIICRSKDDLKNLKLVSQLESSFFDIEIYVAEGDNPSMQRNNMALKAQGDFLWFLDNDSIPDENILSSYMQALKAYPMASICGGPSVLKNSQNLLGQLSFLFFTSSIGVGPSKSRYVRIGLMRTTTESELILCNLLVKKETFNGNGGLNRNIYPNEENEFLKRVKRNDPSLIMIYHPEAVVYRKSREKYLDFLIQLYSYGNGRSKHVNPIRDLRDIIFAIPSILSIYIVILILGMKYNIAFGIPLIIYFSSVWMMVLREMKYQSILVLFISPVFFLSGHVFYGVGFMIGLVKHLFIRKFFFRQRKFSKLNIIQIKKFT